jgi:hypothetical protein
MNTLVTPLWPYIWLWLFEEQIAWFEDWMVVR